MPTGDIPKARDLLEILRVDYDPNGDDLRWDAALDLMKRRFVKKHAARKAPPLSPDVCQAILHWYERSPDTAVLTMANRFGINPGRVSEVISGERDPNTGRMR